MHKSFWTELDQPIDQRLDLNLAPFSCFGLLAWFFESFVGKGVDANIQIGKETTRPARAGAGPRRAATAVAACSCSPRKAARR